MRALYLIVQLLLSIVRHEQDELLIYDKESLNVHSRILHFLPLCGILWQHLIPHYFAQIMLL